MSHIYRIKDYLTHREKKALLAWAASVNDKLTTAHPHISSRLAAIDLTSGDGEGLYFQYYGRLESADILPLVWELKNRIKRDFKVRGAVKEYLTLHLTEEGHNLGLHIDPSIEGASNVRFNIVLRQAWEGGILRVGSEDDLTSCDLDEGDIYTFRPDLYWHEITQVTRGRRIMVSFGFIIPRGRKMPLGHEETEVTDQNRGFEAIQEGD